MSRTRANYCGCGEYIEYGHGVRLCRRCAAGHLNGLPDLQVLGHGAIHVVLSEGKLQAVALVFPDESDRTDGRVRPSEAPAWWNIDIVV